MPQRRGHDKRGRRQVARPGLRPAAFAPKHAPDRGRGFSRMGASSGAKGGADRNGRLASALRDNLRRRKAASRPVEDAAAERAADARVNATPPDKTSGERHES